jgi:hypothetical protein
VLGGKVVTELTASGQKQKTNVYAGGALLAQQDSNFVAWQHNNPLTGSGGSSNAGGLYSREREPDSLMSDVGFEDPYLNFEDPRPDSVQLLGGNSNGECTIEGMTFDCTSAMRLVEMGAAEEVVPYTVFAIYANGGIKAVGGGFLPVNDGWVPADRSIPGEAGGKYGGTESDDHAPDTSSEILAGTRDSSVTVYGGAVYAYSTPQNSGGGGGAGGPVLNTGPRAQFSSKRFNKCLQGFFGVVPQTNGSVINPFFNRKYGGSFTGFSNGDTSHTYTVVTNINETLPL